MSTNNFTPLNDSLKKTVAQTSTASFTKEKEPVIAPKEKIIIQEITEQKVEEEVRPHLKKRPEAVDVPPDLKKIGIQPTPSPQIPTYQNITLPISDDKIISGLHAPISSSLRWLATLAVYLLKMAHLQLKVFHGKIKRVVIRN